jgi:pimeloyl-ACP methyl ester carboxylesterase
MKQLKIIFIPIFLAYFSVAGVFVAIQSLLVFHPIPVNGITPAQFGVKDYKDVSFPSFDGVTLTGWWIEHPPSEVSHPVLLYCHGNADCISQLANVSKIFYDFGFDTLLFDYRSYGASQKAPLNEKGLDGDALAAYQWLRAKGIPDNRIFIWGHSLGSSVAAELATQTHPAGLILEGAFPSIYAVSRQRYPWLLVFPFMIWDKFETGQYVTERTCPLLETHAEKDTIIPIEF